MGLSIEDAAGAASELLQIASDNSETVATILSLIGLGSTVYFTYKQSPKIHQILEDSAREIREIQKSNLTDEEAEARIKEAKTNRLKSVGKASLPIILSAGVTGGCEITALAISKAKISNLASIASFAELSYEELLTKTKEKVGEEKVAEIQEEIKKERVEKFANEEDVEIQQGKGGKYLYIDTFLGTMFRSDNATIMSIINDINKDLTDPDKDITCDIGDIYERIRLRVPGVARSFYWSREAKNGHIHVDLSRSITTWTGEAATLFDYTGNMPEYDDLPFR